MAARHGTTDLLKHVSALDRKFQRLPKKPGVAVILSGAVIAYVVAIVLTALVLS